jgi:hypothetical protein
MVSYLMAFMKSLISTFSILIIFSCRNASENTLEKKSVDSASVAEKKSDSTIARDMYTILIVPEQGDTLHYTKEELTALKKRFPGINTNLVSHPDTLFLKEKFFKYKDSKERTKTISFSCEVCKDGFYETYAYFLKSKNGDKKYDFQRKKLIEIFRCINEVYDDLRHGGTYFGHQYHRILGYAEYAVYKYDKDRKKYIINLQFNERKKLYIAFFRKGIFDEINNNNGDGMTGDDKVKLQKHLFKIVDKLDKLITDYFYLNNARQFQYSKY